jgi:hypothetical protein
MRLQIKMMASSTQGLMFLEKLEVALLLKATKDALGIVLAISN